MGDHSINDDDKISAKINAIENLLIGNGAEDFQTLEGLAKQFCPFEAIGMVKMEIRHAHFLCFLLDPKASHPFHDKFLKAFLQAVVSGNTTDKKPTLMDVHLMDCSNAIIYREKSNIDLLIEIESASGERLVVAVEMKIHASEAKHQLKKYSENVQKRYPNDKWNQQFAFLTLDKSEASDDRWIALSFSDVIDRFDKVVKNSKFEGKAVELYNDYTAMMRKHLMPDQKSELEKLSRRIWQNHRQAMDVLVRYEPNLQSEILDWIARNWAMPDIGEEKFRIKPDTSSPKILRFQVEEWLKTTEFQTGNDDKNGEHPWVKSESLVSIELYFGDTKCRLSFVLGPGNQGNREKIYAEAKKRHDDSTDEFKLGKRTENLNSQYKHLLSFVLVDIKNIIELEKTTDEYVKEAGKEILDKIKEVLKEQLPIFTDLLKTALEKGNSPH
ncbi:MAG: PD-(D/E)XK nuclease family protein [Candidatus Puniceispirillales bacterium WSBS_2018_MAG_OTU23]